MTTAFLFPGQGAQVVGMGADVALEFPAAAAVFEKADALLGYDLSRICFEGPPEKLNSTTFSQPAIFTTSAAILEVLRTAPAAAALKPDVTAGLSLGEYTALYAAGLIGFEDALGLVQERGRAMQAASDRSEGGMVAVIGLDEQKTDLLCRQASCGELLVAVNFNCPGQVAVSGTVSACRRAEELAPEHGAIKAVRLEVAGAFHTEMMAPAAQQLSQALTDTHIAEPADIRVVRNIDAEYYTSADDIRTGLARQLTSPIYWQKCVERLLADGVRDFYEIGPGRVLTALMKRISRKTKVINISSADAMKRLLL
jgi:[acyl-carrier-protein] S-malonyltransferase